MILRQFCVPLIKCITVLSLRNAHFLCGLVDMRDDLAAVRQKEHCAPVITLTNH